MAQVIISGWKPGLQKIGLTRLLQEQAGLSLATAYDATNRCLAGETLTIDLPSVTAAETFAEDAIALGAIARVDRIEQRR